MCHLLSLEHCFFSILLHLTPVVLNVTVLPNAFTDTASKYTTANESC